VVLVFRFESFAFGVYRDLARQVSAGDGGGHVGNVADLVGQVLGHRVDVVGEILPGARDARHDSLAAEFPFGPYFAGDTADFGSESVELVHHGVDRVFQLENFALHIDGDLAGEIALGDGGRHLGNVPDLCREVGAHGVHGIGQVLPRARHIGHFRAAAEFAFGSYFARH